MRTKDKQYFYSLPYLFTALIILSAFDLSAKSNNVDSIEVTTQKGVVKIASMPKKVVIFDIGTLETYKELGIPVGGVTNNVPTYLSEYKDEKYQKLGGIKGPNIEDIKVYAPDLIIISGRQSAQYDSLSQIAPTLFLGVDSKDYWNSFENNVKAIAKIHGKEKLAEEKLAALRKKRDLVKAKTAGDKNKGLIVLQVRGGHTAYGPESRFGFIHDVLGFQPTIPLDDESHTGHRFKEGDGLVKKADPDYLFLIDRDSAVGGEKKDVEDLLSAELKETKAYKNKKVVDLPGNIWYISGGGLISVDKKITDIGEQLYGISF